MDAWRTLWYGELFQKAQPTANGDYAVTVALQREWLQQFDRELAEIYGRPRLNVAPNFEKRFFDDGLVDRVAELEAQLLSSGGSAADQLSAADRVWAWVNASCMGISQEVTDDSFPDRAFLLDLYSDLIASVTPEGVQPSAEPTTDLDPPAGRSKKEQERHMAEVLHKMNGADLQIRKKRLERFLRQAYLHLREVHHMLRTKLDEPFGESQVAALANSMDRDSYDDLVFRIAAKMNMADVIDGDSQWGGDAPAAVHDFWEVELVMLAKQFASVRRQLQLTHVAIDELNAKHDADDFADGARYLQLAIDGELGGVGVPVAEMIEATSAYNLPPQQQDHTKSGSKWFDYRTPLHSTIGGTSRPDPNFSAHTDPRLQRHPDGTPVNISRPSISKRARINTKNLAEWMIRHDEPESLKEFVSNLTSRILPRTRNMYRKRVQRRITRYVKRARELALLPYFVPYRRVTLEDMDLSHESNRPNEEDYLLYKKMREEIIPSWPAAIQPHPDVIDDVEKVFRPEWFEQSQSETEQPRNVLEGFTLQKIPGLEHLHENYWRDVALAEKVAAERGLAASDGAKPKLEPVPEEEAEFELADPGPR